MAAAAEVINAYIEQSRQHWNQDYQWTKQGEEWWSAFLERIHEIKFPSTRSFRDITNLRMFAGQRP
jgi:hypothetical protein